MPKRKPTHEPAHEAEYPADAARLALLPWPTGGKSSPCTGPMPTTRRRPSANARRAWNGRPPWNASWGWPRKKAGPSEEGPDHAGILDPVRPFGSLAALSAPPNEQGPWLCVPASRRVCLCRGQQVLLTVSAGGLHPSWRHMKPRSSLPPVQAAGQDAFTTFSADTGKVPLAGHDRGDRFRPASGTYHGIGSWRTDGIVVGVLRPGVRHGTHGPFARVLPVGGEKAREEITVS
jgi:hypothetical protein